MNKASIFTCRTFCLMAVLVIPGNQNLVNAADTQPPEAKVIYLYAPNNAVQTVTIWLPKAIGSRNQAAPEANQPAMQTIDLRAPNSPTQSVTVWSNVPKDNRRLKGEPQKSKHGGILMDGSGDGSTASEQHK